MVLLSPVEVHRPVEALTCVMVTEVIILGDRGTSLSTTHNSAPLMIFDVTPGAFFITISITYPEKKSAQ